MNLNEGERRWNMLSHGFRGRLDGYTDNDNNNICCNRPPGGWQHRSKGNVNSASYDKSEQQRIRQLVTNSSFNKWYLSQLCQTYSLLATCPKWSFKCGDWPLLPNTSKLGNLVQKSLKNNFEFNLHFNTSKKCEKRWPRCKKLSNNFSILKILKIFFAMSQKCSK